MPRTPPCRIDKIDRVAPRIIIERQARGVSERVGRDESPDLRSVGRVLDVKNRRGDSVGNSAHGGCPKTTSSPHPVFSSCWRKREEAIVPHFSFENGRPTLGNWRWGAHSSPADCAATIRLSVCPPRLLRRKFDFQPLEAIRPGGERPCHRTGGQQQKVSRVNGLTSQRPLTAHNGEAEKIIRCTPGSAWPPGSSL